MRKKRAVRFDLTLNRVHAAGSGDHWRESRNGSEWLRDAMRRHLDGMHDDGGSDDDAMPPTPQLSSCCDDDEGQGNKPA